mgnify:CR=1 FL=1
MQISSVGFSINNYNYKKISFKGIVDITRPYDQERERLREKTFVWRRGKKMSDISKQEAAAIKAYALAQEERLLEIRNINAQNKQLLEQAKLNNESAERIAELEAKLQKSEETLKIQTELAKVNKNVGWGRIAGYDQEKTILTDEFINNLGLEKNGEKDLIFPNGILFFGPTGNGKTTFAKAFAEQTQCPLIEIPPFTDDLRRELQDALTESKSNYTKNGTRTIILMDEFDNFGSNEPDNKRNVAALKAMMVDVAKKYKATMFLTTNNPLDIDSILLADSRCPIRVYLDPPNEDNMDSVLKYYLEGKTDNYINYDNLISELSENRGEGAYSNSRIKTVVESCYKETAKLGRSITEGDLIAKIRSTLPDITKEHLDKYANDIIAICGRK